MPLFRKRFTAVLALGLFLGAAGCDVTTPFPVGKLSARVLDQNNSGIQGALLDLYKVDEIGSILWRRTATSSDGIGVFGASDGGVVEGDYFIRLGTTALYELAPGETNDRPVTVAEGDDIIITFRVVPRTGP